MTLLKKIQMEKNI